MLEYITSATSNKDFFTTIIILGILVIIIIPLMYFIINKLTKDIIDSLNNLGLNFTKTFKEHEEKDTNELKEVKEMIKYHHENANRQFIQIGMKMGNTILDMEQTVDILKSKMWYVSFGKLEFIKQVMIFNHIRGRRKEITEKIKTELGARSEIYLKDFQKFITPIGDLGDWLNNNFKQKEFDEFVEKIVDIVYDDSLTKTTNMSKEAIISLKVNDISTMMKTLQERLGNKLREDIKNFNK